jgi:membrane protein
MSTAASPHAGAHTSAPSRFTGGWWWRLFVNAGVDWWNDNAMRLAAALAYYMIFSIAPMLLIGISIVGMVYGTEAAREGLGEELNSLVGPQAAAAILDMVRATGEGQTNTATIVGFVVLFFGASVVFAELRASLNKVWEVKPSNSSGIWTVVRGRLMAFVMVLLIGFLLLASLVLSTLLAAFGDLLAEYVGGGGWILPTLGIVGTIVIATLLFAMIYRVLPDRYIPWSDVWVGALATAVLFAIGKELISLYLGRMAVASTYGAAGSLMVLLLWLYYSSLIFLYGAELTQAYARLGKGEGSSRTG